MASKSTVLSSAWSASKASISRCASAPNDSSSGWHRDEPFFYGARHGFAGGVQRLVRHRMRNRLLTTALARKHPVQTVSARVVLGAMAERLSEPAEALTQAAGSEVADFGQLLEDGFAL